MKVTIKFLEDNNVFANGDIFSAILFTENTTEILQANNSILTWSYTHLQNGFSNNLTVNFNLKTSFESIDLSQGVFQGLTLRSIEDEDKDKETEVGFSLTSTISTQVISNSKFFDMLTFPLSILLSLAYVFYDCSKKIKLKSNFGYFIGRILVLHASIFDQISSGYPGLTEILVTQYVEVLMMLLFFGLSHKKLNLLSDLNEFFFKKSPLILVAACLLILVNLLGVENHLLIFFIPLVMALVDRSLSKSCQPLRGLLIFELSKFVIIFVGCFFPCYMIHTDNSLLMEFDYPNLALFFFVGFVALPGIFYLHIVFARKTIQTMEVELNRKELHGKSRNNPICIQEGQGDIISTRSCYLKNMIHDYISFYFNKKVVFYHPNFFVGVIEADFEMRRTHAGAIKAKQTGYLNFYFYEKRENRRAGSLVQHCKQLGYKPSLRFRISKRWNDYRVLNLIPVESPEATSAQRFIAVVMTKTSKLIFSFLNYDVFFLFLSIITL